MYILNLQAHYTYSHITVHITYLLHSYKIRKCKAANKITLKHRYMLAGIRNRTPGSGCSR